MFNNQLIQNATLTASVVGIVGLSSLLGAKPSQAASVTIPLSVDSFTLAGNAKIVPPNAENPFFTSDMISIVGSGLATSQPSPFLDLGKLKRTILHFNYAFLGTGNLGLRLNNISTGKSISIDSLGNSAGKIADFELTQYIVDPGLYTVTHQLTGGGIAHFNNFSIVTESVPEPTTTLGLLGLGIGAVTLSRKRKISASVFSKSAA